MCAIYVLLQTRLISAARSNYCHRPTAVTSNTFVLKRYQICSNLSRVCIQSYPMHEIATAIPSPSVHPSVTRRHCVRTAKRNVEILLPSDIYLRNDGIVHNRAGRGVDFVTFTFHLASCVLRESVSWWTGAVHGGHTTPHHCTQRSISSTQFRVVIVVWFRHPGIDSAACRRGTGRWQHSVHTEYIIVTLKQSFTEEL